MTDTDQITILIADDHPLVRDGIILRMEKYPDINIVGEANNGKTAIDLAEKLNPDIILMDISMPDMTGIKAMKKILSKMPHIKFIMLTMYATKEYIQGAVDAGAMGYIVKDNSATEMVEAIKAVHKGDPYYSTNVTHALLNNRTSEIEKYDKTPILSNRERAVLALVAEGLKNKDIGNKLNISSRTVETHRQRIKAKLGLNSTAEIIRYAIDHVISQEIS